MNNFDNEYTDYGEDESIDNIPKVSIDQQTPSSSANVDERVQRLSKREIIKIKKRKQNNDLSEAELKQYEHILRVEKRYDIIIFFFIRYISYYLEIKKSQSTLS